MLCASYHHVDSDGTAAPVASQQDEISPLAPQIILQVHRANVHGLFYQYTATDMAMSFLCLLFGWIDTTFGGAGPRKAYVKNTTFVASQKKVFIDILERFDMVLHISENNDI